MAHAGLKLIPGVDQNRTEALNEAAIFESNLIRFVPDRQGQGLPQKLGGWEKFIPSKPWDSTVRSLHGWSDIDSLRYLAIGADTSLWVSEVPLDPQDVSPQYYKANISVDASTILDSADVTIGDVGSNVSSFDSVFIETPISVGGVILFGFYPCSANGADSYDITAKNIIGGLTPATATVSSGGAVPVFTSTIDPAPTPSITVTLADHGYSVGSTFPVLVETAIDGVSLYGNYIVLSVIPGVSFTINADSAPTNILTVTSATWLATVATFGIAYDAILEVGSSVVVAGMTPAGYNGTFVVTSSSPGTFAVTIAVDPGASTVFGTATADTTSYEMNGGDARIIYYIGQQVSTPASGYGDGGYGDGGYGSGITFSGSGRTYTGITIVGAAGIATATLPTNVYFVPGSVIVVTGSTNFNGTYDVISSTSGTTSTVSFADSSVATDTGTTVSVETWGFEMPDLNFPDWSLDNWGGYLMASPHMGEIFYWNPADANGHAAVVPNAPLVNEGFFVAMPERQIIAYGSTFTGFQDPMLVRWCDIGNFTNWIGTVTNQAGSFRIPKGSKIIGGIQGPQQGLLWTDVGLWSMQYINLPLVYSFNEVATGCGLIGRRAAGTLSGNVYWMSQSQFFMLSGSGVQTITCPIWDIVFQAMDPDQDTWGNIRCAPNSRFGEISWYFPTVGSGGVPTKYVKYNTILNQWDYGDLTRTAWIDQGVFGPPIGSDGNDYIQQHEVSNNADGQVLNASFQTGYFALQEGDLKTFVDQVWPDMKWGQYDQAQGATVQITFFTADYPGDTPRVYPFTLTSGTQFVTPRFRARLVSIKIESNDIDSFWRLGNIRYRYQPDGKF
jgi:hypothetical protein